MKALAQCRSTLTHLILSRVALAAGDEDWKRVGGVLLTMPALVTAELQMAYYREEPLGFWTAGVQTLSGGNPPGIRLEGRHDVVKGLQALSDIGSAYFQ